MVFRISKIHTNADFTFSNNKLIKNRKNLLTMENDCVILFSASEVPNTILVISASGSVGGVQPCQGWGRGFESRLALFIILKIKKSYFGRKLPE